MSQKYNTNEYIWGETYPIEAIRIETFRKEPRFILYGEQTSLSFTGVEFQLINVSQPDTISSLKVKRSTMTMVMLVAKLSNISFCPLRTIRPIFLTKYYKPLTTNKNEDHTSDRLPRLRLCLSLPSM